MMKQIMPAFFCLFFSASSVAQQTKDSAIAIGKKMVTLSEIVVDNQLNVPVFINRIKNDSTFYKAFRNLHVLGFSSINDIRMLKKDGTAEASLIRKTK